MRIVVELLADRQDGNLVRSQPQRELTGRMLNKHSHEAFHGAERSTVNHYGTVLLIVSTGIFQLETFRQVVVHLDGTQLPTATDGILHHEVQFRTIESGFSIFYFCLQPLFFTSFDDGSFCFFPVLVATDVFFAVHLVTQGNLCLEVLEVHRFEHDGDNVHDTEELILHLVRTAEDMRIILRKATYTCQTVQLATLLVTANRTELCQTQRQVFVRTG